MAQLCHSSCKLSSKSYALVISVLDPMVPREEARYYEQRTYLKPGRIFAWNRLSLNMTKRNDSQSKTSGGSIAGILCNRISEEPTTTTVLVGFFESLLALCFSLSNADCTLERGFGGGGVGCMIKEKTSKAHVRYIECERRQWPSKWNNVQEWAKGLRVVSRNDEDGGPSVSWYPLRSRFIPLASISRPLVGIPVLIVRICSVPKQMQFTVSWWIQSPAMDHGVPNCSQKWKLPTAPRAG